MKECLIKSRFDFYESTDTPEKLAKKAHFKFFGRELEESDLPLNPFEFLIESGALYAFMDFKDLEGFYLLPINQEPAFIGINKNKPIARQRFTAAHELCHHLKDNITQKCKIGMTDSIEVYANKFAAEFLMPRQLLFKELRKANISSSELDKILILSKKFGVSFHSIFIRINSLMGWGLTTDEINKARQRYRPEKQKKKFNLVSDLALYRQVLDFYQFIEVKPLEKIKNDFLRFVIANDHRMENGELSLERINEIIALHRLNKLEKELTDSEIEVLGQYRMYENIFSNISNKGSYLSLIDLHRKFVEFTPYPEVGGAFREARARIVGTTVKTVDPSKIGINLYNICFELDNNIADSQLKKSEVLLRIIVAHHEMTVIHPFNDGNGRTLRALLNMNLLEIGIPPIFITEQEKENYRQGLEVCDTSDEPLKYNMLSEFFIQKIINNFSHFISK